MELAYLPDSMSRYNGWSAYPSWDENNFSHNIATRKQQHSAFREAKTNEKNCSICQQKKKRFLFDYIKNKQTNSTRIQEEEEEETEGEKSKHEMAGKAGDKK